MPGWAAIEGSMCHVEGIYMIIFLSEVLDLFEINERILNLLCYLRIQEHMRLFWGY